MALAVIALVSQEPNTSAKPAAQAAQQSSPTRTGEQVFNDNCVRCHTPPSVMGQRITGTIVMHMRTRARLSRKDQELLLKYLAP